MDIGRAIDAMRNGFKVTRTGWNGKGIWIALQEPDSKSMMDRPYLYMRAVDGDYVPWVASQTDLLEDDWERI